MNQAELWKPYSGDGVTIEQTRSWLVSEGRSRGFSEEVVGVVMDQMFLELDKGADFTGPCFCGCDSPRPHTHINHWALKKCIELGEKLDKVIIQTREDQLNKKIEAYAMGRPELEGHNETDDLYEMLELVYSQFNGQAARDQLEAKRLHYYRKVPWYRKPLMRLWKENIWGPFKQWTGMASAQ